MLIGIASKRMPRECNDAVIDDELQGLGIYIF
jgi:hypothetical protein